MNLTAFLFNRLFFATASLLALFLVMSNRSTTVLGQVKRADVIHVGVTEYQNIDETYKKYEQFFKELAAHADKNQSVTFQFAIGTYGEVLEWYNKRQIDIGILSAMPTAELLLAGQQSNLERAYLGDISVSLSRGVSEQTVSKLFPTRPRDPFTYRTGCIVLKNDKDLRTIDDIKQYWNAGKLKFLFVRPYSMSGYIVPLSVLNDHQINIFDRTDHVEFTYQHKKSLEELIKQIPNVGVKGGMHYVAFVLDDTYYKTDQISNYDPSQDVFYRIPIPELDQYAIPREIVLANYLQERDKLKDDELYSSKFEKYKAIMSTLLSNWQRATASKIQAQMQHATGVAKITPVVDWRSRGSGWTNDYVGVEKALDPKTLPRELLYKSNFDDLLDDMKQSKVPPRLALVLSGGGAKCAYQAGAIIEIEKKLRAQGLDIGLVVGTSGGAINALLVALGVTASENAENALSKTWQSFNQQQFLQPSRRFTLIFGVSFGLLQCLLIAVSVLLFDRETMNWKVTGLVLGLIGLFEFVAAVYFNAPVLWVVVIVAAEIVLVGLIVGVVKLVDYGLGFITILRDLEHWRRLTVVLMLLFSAIEFIIARVPSIANNVESINDNHWVAHAWTAVTLLSVWSFPYPLLIAISMVLVGGSFVRTLDWTRFREPFVWWLSIILIFVSTLLVLEALFKENAPSRAIGIEQAFIDSVPKLIADTVKPGFTVKSSADPTLADVSQQVMNNNLLKRDLIITASNLPFYAGNDLRVNNLPDDLYFYFKSDSSPQKVSAEVPADKRFIPLKFNQDKLLDVVIGSSTIYPIFPSRALYKVRQGTEEVASLETLDLRIIDGGFIHNVPIEAAYLWGATHIILIDASPTPQLIAPRNFWDNSLTAFSYLFRQAQRTDTLMRSGTFELRPKSKCEKDNIKPVCTYADGLAEPDLDTFDFSRPAAEKAFEQGKRDVEDPKPLLERVPGAPVWQTVTAPIAPNQSTGSSG